jgi:hypothetical protein
MALSQGYCSLRPGLNVPLLFCLSRLKIPTLLWRESSTKLSVCLKLHVATRYHGNEQKGAHAIMIKHVGTQYPNIGPVQPGMLFDMLFCLNLGCLALPCVTLLAGAGWWNPLKAGWWHLPCRNWCIPLATG